MPAPEISQAIDASADARTDGLAPSALDTGTLGKAISLLDRISACDTPPRFTDLLQITGLPRGSLHRQLRHLMIEGLLELTPEGGYVPGLRLLEFASRAWARNSFRQVAEPHLHQLHAMTGETVHLGVLRGTEIVYLDKVEGQQAVRMYSQIGNASPVYCTGIGKAALSTLEETVLERVLNGIVFRRFTAGTHGDAAALRRDLEQIRVRGYAFDLEEHQPGIRCVAAAITSDEVGFAGGISITAPAFRVSLDQLQDWTQPVMDAARAMTADLARRLGPRKTK